MELCEAIYYRKTTEFFSNKKLKDHLIEDVKRACDNITYIDEDLNIQAHVIDKGHLIHFLMGKECKIKAPHYIVVTTDGGKDHLQNIGYAMEEVVLFMTSLGIATCWIESHLTKADILDCLKTEEDERDFVRDEGFEVAEMIKNAELDESIGEPCIIIAFGMPIKSEPLFRTRFAIPDRKDISKISKGMKGEWEDVMELVRRAPSVKNTQPWYVLRDKKGIHFFEKVPKKAVLRDMSKISMGIALKHFDLACRERGMTVVYKDMNLRNRIGGREYFISAEPRNYVADDLDDEE